MFDKECLIGLHVFWYPKAMTKKPPDLATIVRVFDGGCVNLDVVNGNGEHIFVDASYHVSRTDMLYDEAGRMLDHVPLSGAWELTPPARFVYDMMVASKERQAAKKPKESAAV